MKYSDIVKHLKSFASVVSMFGLGWRWRDSWDSSVGWNWRRSRWSRFPEEEEEEEEEEEDKGGEDETMQIQFFLKSGLRCNVESYTFLIWNLGC